MKRALCLLLGWLALNFTASGTGLIIIHEEDFWRRPPPRVVPPETIPPIRPPYFPPRPPVWAALETAFTKADVRIKDQLATTSIEQEFYNPNARQLEGTFLFPVPRGAQINKFTMEINGKPVEAELLAADKARGIYEDIVRKLKDPALLEYAGRDLFRVRIFPIEANSRKRITLSYSQLLKSDNGLVNFILPLNTDKFSAKPVKNVSLKIDLETKRPLKSIYSPSHKVEIKRSGGNKATVGYEASDVKPDADFQLFFAQEQDDLGLNLLTYKTSGEDGYFVLLASPGAEVKNTKVIPKDVMFVLDTSGSMAGAKLEQAKKALAFCVENLNDNDRFEVLRFATEVEPLFDKLVEVSNDHRANARSFIKDLKPLGGTAIDEALRKALALRPDKGDRPYLVIFLTDGRPTVGNTKEDDIVANVSSASKGHVRVFCFGIGHDVNTHMLDKITEETRAVSQYVLPEEDIEVKVSSFFSKIKEPVLASPKISFPDSVRVTKLYPSPVPDIFKGEQLVLAGRYSGKGDGAIQIEGTVNGETKTFAYDVKFADEANDHEFIPRLWATRRVGYLLDEIRLRGENKELKDEVVELARQYSIVTPYTAYLITEDETRRGVAQNVRTLQFENEALRREARQNYDFFMKEKGGERGVASARSYFQLKAADAPADAIALGNVEVLRAAPQAPPSRQAGRPAVTRLPTITVSKEAAAQVTAQQYAEQSRFVGGKTFFQNQAQWVDADAQKFENAKKVRIQFGSPEYFELQKKHPKAQAWLAVGNNVQFVLAGTVYEIHE
jgi:Ca-activated chloride channel family protein